MRKAIRDGLKMMDKVDDPENIVAELPLFPFFFSRQGTGFLSG
jgi:hypothetical protein